MEYGSVIEEEKFMEWVELLPTEGEKLWHLRRCALNYRQFNPQYLTKSEAYFSNDEERIIRRYKAVLQLTESDPEIEVKYLGYLVRRINKHLLEGEVGEEYGREWSQKVAFFREEMNWVISKERKGLSEAERKAVFSKYYKMWV